MTINDIISQITTNNKWIAADSEVTPRFIYNIVKNKASTLIKRETDRRRLVNSDSIFTPFECLELQKVSATECDVTTCTWVRRSINKLPKLEEGIYTYVIQGVYNIENNVEIKPTTLRQHINRSKLRYTSPDIYYIIKNSYLYILDPNIEAVNMYYFSTDLMGQIKECQSAFDLEFRFPSYLLDPLYSMVNEELLNYHKFKKDTHQDNQDETA